MESVKERKIGSQSWGATGNSYKSPNLRPTKPPHCFHQSTNKQTI